MNESTRLATRHWTSAQPIVSAFVASIVRDFRDRDDVLQETALAIFESIDSYNPDFPFNAWAIGVARNQIGLYLRRRHRERLVFNDSVIGCIETAFNEMNPSPMLDFVPGCVDQLEGRARQLCDLRYQNDLKPAAIGKQVGMSPNAVAKALQRIREQIRNCVQAKAAAEGFAS
ncbi:RNA polymerase sigma factor CnrH [Rosistilla ulvae]|uniref:RNA polymerase sigma factor CnrH n=1 Tax=Rosistilla ulvae TaxID=1930277 RepID=A0A517M341_9BACT|nr:sigma-70 family RNA polymerase sigma factor [Rosistilla ulvae]QDS89292.1 RNA polymerase sigma factor CnrH [Rosistilla ulvae]